MKEARKEAFMVAVINSQEIVNKNLWSYRPVFLDGNKEAKSVHRLVEEVFNESIKQNTYAPVVDRVELAARMGVSEKTIQRTCNKLMANQKIYVERVSKGQYQFALFATNINLPTDCVVKDFELETKFLAELEKQQQKANQRANRLANQRDDKTTSLEISPTSIDENKINEISTTSLLLDNQSNLDINLETKEVNVVVQPITNTSTNSVAASRPAATTTPSLTSTQVQGQQLETNIAKENNQLTSKAKSKANVGLFAKRLVTEQQQVDDLFCDLTDEQQDLLIELTPIIEVFWKKTGKLELLEEQWKEYQPNLDWYEFLTEKLMETVKIAYSTRYSKFLSETELSIDEVKKGAISQVLAYWENINKVSSENIIIPPTTLTLGTDNKVNLASLSTTNQTASKQVSRFDRIMANVIKNEEASNVDNIDNVDDKEASQTIKSNSVASTNTSHANNTNISSDSGSNKKFSIREMMKQSRAKAQSETKPSTSTKKQDNNVSKNPYPEKPSGFSHIGETLFSQTLGLDKIKANVERANNINQEIPVIGINLNQQLNESSSDNFSDFSNKDFSGHKCPQIDDQQSDNQNDQVLNTLTLISGEECPQINDPSISNENDQISSAKVDISGQECPQICANEQNDHGQAHNSDHNQLAVTKNKLPENEDMNVPKNTIEPISPTFALVIDNTTTTTVASIDSVVPSSIPTTTTNSFKALKLLKLSLNSSNLNINKEEEKSFKSLRGAPGNNQGDEDSTTSTITSTNLTNNGNTNFINIQTTENKDVKEETEKQLKGKSLITSITAISAAAQAESQVEQIQPTPSPALPALKLVSIEGEEVKSLESLESLESVKPIESTQSTQSTQCLESTDLTDLTASEYDYYQTVKIVERIEKEQREIVIRGDVNCCYCEGYGRLNNIPDLYKSDNENSNINGKWKKFPEVRSVPCVCAKAYDMLEYMEGREVLGEMRSLTNRELELREIMIFCLDEKAREVAEQASQVKVQQIKQNDVVTSSKKAKSSNSVSASNSSSNSVSKPISNLDLGLENEKKAKNTHKQKSSENLQNREQTKLEESPKAGKANKTNKKAETINWAKYTNPLPERKSVPKELFPYIGQLNEKAKERTTNGKTDIVIKLSADRQSWLIPNPYGQERKSVASFWDWLLYSLREPNTTQPVRMACAGYYLGKKEEEIIGWLERRAELGVGGSVGCSFSNEEPKAGQGCPQSELLTEDEDFNSDNVIVVDGDLSVEYGDLRIEVDTLIANSNHPSANNQQVNF